MAIKLLINEKFGDGIMSAIDFYMTVRLVVAASCGPPNADLSVVAAAADGNASTRTPQVGSTTGKMGEKRVVITFNGKFLPFIEQLVEKNTAKSPED
jgi:cyanate lyase